MGILLQVFAVIYNKPLAHSAVIRSKTVFATNFEILSVFDFIISFKNDVVKHV